MFCHHFFRGQPLTISGFAISGLSFIAGIAFTDVFAGSGESKLLTLTDQASTTYCEQYTDETVHYLLTQGTPDDVTMMENAVGYRDDGQWTIDSETLGSQPGNATNEYVVHVRCTWNTPIEELNFPAELQYRMILDSEQKTVLSVEDAN